MDISVIVPIYKGQKYISKIQNMIAENLNFAKEQSLALNVELIFVNDFPADSIKCDYTNDKGFETIILVNGQNCGIHKTRVNGLQKARGNYILFLDQDDEITPNCLYSQISTINDNDIVVGNGYRGIKGEYKKIYRSLNKQKLCCDEYIFLKAANQIVSPGHCLIKKGAVPQTWCNNIMNDNGGDDLFLWLLMFANNKKFCINPECVYKHVETGANLSNNLDVMYRSSENLIDIAKKSQVIEKRKIDIYSRRIKFLKRLKSESGFLKIWICLNNLDICLTKLYAYYR